ncbi:alpha-L-arabinofuranosidase [Mangrovactinospora gilvigrisea]|uniref:non-reducing end alpha-L-arabinofuranosidase n=1 Tax=Mangrovactinospora gilvigrisea TaxID=1428644 RepID=A0A1J7BSH3_9ACTN|nr:alpha-N-arabinofuranosidase [Mangrovactinospora gilvigrisea]OIV36409.1 alpha-L-arabinofuranosidase [Mangrovactinospora gilvigrisea]
MAPDSTPARIDLDPRWTVGDVDPRLFGSFVEHYGRCVYTGIYEPEHPTADAEGFRGDTAELVRELGVPILRYPGGNFVSSYQWEDGIGPRDKRPVRLDGNWRALEDNQVGTDEFLSWTKRVGSEAMMAVNLGNRGTQAAMDLVEYCNHPSGSYWSDLRRANGYKDPHDVRVWCLGNEMDGLHQVGHKTAYEYGRLAAETAKAMRMIDPGLELVACGSLHPRVATAFSWESEVLEHSYEFIDYLAIHAYYEQRGEDRDSFLAAAIDMDRFIESIVATLDFAKARGRHKKQVNISFDEWNVWYNDAGEVAGQDFRKAPRQSENMYNVADAVVVGNLLISLLKHADRVKMGCLAQLVNAIAPIHTEPGGAAWRLPTFHPFALTSAHGRGTVLNTLVTSPRYETRWFGPDTPQLDAVAVRAEDGESVTVFAVNRSRESALPVEVDLRGFPGLTRVSQVVLADEDPEATNTAERPDRVVPRSVSGARVDGGTLSALLPPLSWNMLTVRAA